MLTSMEINQKIVYTYNGILPYNTVAKRINHSHHTTVWINLRKHNVE